MTLRTLIVDDEPLALDLLESYVTRTPFLRLSGRCNSAAEVLQRLDEEAADLLFCDIQMPGLNGLELSRLVTGSDRHIRVIFTTAFEQYALEGFRVDALDYLLKPFNYAEFLRAAMKARQWFFREDRPIEPESQPKIPEGIFVRADYKQVRVLFADIQFIEGVKDYLRIHLADGSSVLTQMSLKGIEEQLPEGFMRVHRSFIVHLHAVRTLERNRIVFGKHYIPISESCKTEFLERLGCVTL